MVNNLRNLILIKTIKAIVFTFAYLFTAQIFAQVVVTIKDGNDPTLNINYSRYINNFPLAAGFKDRTAFKPAGNNNARTLGQARFNAFQYAVNKISNKINSDVKINLVVIFYNGGETATGAVLAGATATNYVTLDSAPFKNTLYALPLAEKILGANINGASTGVNAFDIVILVNADIDTPAALGKYKFYYGFDEKPPVVQLGVSDFDFISTITHEIVHGLGFATPMNSNGSKRFGLDDAFMRNLEHHDAVNLKPSFSLMTDSQRATAMRSGANLHWIGPALLRTVSTETKKNSGIINGHATMYAPSTYLPGSSVSHFSTLFGNPVNQLMEPVSEGTSHDIGLAAQVLDDIGWGAVNSNPLAADLSVSVINANIGPAQGSREMYYVTVKNNGVQTASGIVLTNFLPANSSLISVTPADDETCDFTNVIENRIVSCYVASLPPSSSTVFNVVIQQNNPGLSVFSANVEVLNPDAVTVNNNAITLAATNVESKPVLSFLSDKTIEEGQTLRFTVTAADPNGTVPVLSYSSNKVISATLTDQSNGTASFNWTPTANDRGVNVINFVATDISALMDTLTVNIIVIEKSTLLPPENNPPVDITTPPARSNNDVSTGGCTLNSTAKFDPIFPVLLLLLWILYFVRKKKYND